MVIQFPMTMILLWRVRKNFMYGITVTYTQNNFLNDCTTIYMTMTVFWKDKRNFGNTITYEHDTALEGKKKIHVWHHHYLYTKKI